MLNIFCVKLFFVSLLGEDDNICIYNILFNWQFCIVIVMVRFDCKVYWVEYQIRDLGDMGLNFSLIC